MMLRIDSAFAAAFAISFLYASAASSKAETGAGDGKQLAVTGSHSHRAYAGHRLHKQTTALPLAARIEPPSPYYAWGAPPLQDPRDAYHGYFANPIDSPNYHGSADRR